MAYKLTIRVNDFPSASSPIDSVNKITKLCDYHAVQNSKFIGYTFIFIGYAECLFSRENRLLLGKCFHIKTVCTAVSVFHI